MTTTVAAIDRTAVDAFLLAGEDLEAVRCVAEWALPDAAWLWVSTRGPRARDVAAEGVDPAYVLADLMDLINAVGRPADPAGPTGQLDSRMLAALGSAVEDQVYQLTDAVQRDRGARVAWAETRLAVVEAARTVLKRCIEALEPPEGCSAR
jgi:hypothetical protein